MVHLELLAPAKNTEIGIAAIDCGADAVYIAGPDFGARKAAGNSIEDIRLLCEYAHKFGVRVFITLNTILFEEEIDNAYKLMLAVQDAGADAVIIQDLAMVRLLKCTDKGLSRVSIPLHASTQCSIRTPEEARFYESLGFSRLVLERELSLSQIIAIRKSVNCELEFFVHGALCVCYSGQCYLSEKLTGRSANRGECVQACRSRYDLIDSEGHVILHNKAILSLKDYNLKNRIKDLADSGICSFKIEGRLKNSSYVKNVVREYSMALDELCSKEPCKYSRASFGKISQGFIPDPAKTFNRGYTELFIDGKRGKWSAMDTPKSMGEAIGTVSTVKRMNNGNMNLIVKPLSKSLILTSGDGFSFVTENKIVGFRGDVCNGLSIRCKPVSGIKTGTLLYRNISIAFEKELEKNSCTRAIETNTDIIISDNSKGDYILLAKAITEDGREACLKETVSAEPAKDTERMKSVIISQISKKSGIYNFSLKSLTINTSNGNTPYMATAFINSVRRGLAKQLDNIACKAVPMADSIEKGYGRKEVATISNTFSYKSNIANSLSESVYRSKGAEFIEKAFELTHRPDAELMRTKYCVRYELGMCPKHHNSKDNSTLYLLNNGKKLALNFDCKVCEMTVTEPNSR